MNPYLVRVERKSGRWWVTVLDGDTRVKVHTSRSALFALLLARRWARAYGTRVR